MILIPLIYPEALPHELADGIDFGTASTLRRLPPPPPPPAARGETGDPHVSEIDQGLHAPTKIPKDIKMIKEDAAPPPPSMGVAGMAGMAGGSPGGVFGRHCRRHGPWSGDQRCAAQAHWTGSVSLAVLSRVTRTKFVQPAYPPIAKIAHMSGTVVLHAIISKSGSIEKLLKCKRAATRCSSTSALDAVKQWRYKPYIAERRAHRSRYDDHGELRSERRHD